MKEINDIVTAKLAAMHESGAIEKMISESVEKSIASAIKESFERYGSITKTIEEAIKAGFKLDPGAIDFDHYNAVMLSAVKQKVMSAFGDDARSRFMQEMDKVLEPAPESIDIHDFVSRIAEMWRENYSEFDEYDECATVEINPAFDFSQDTDKRVSIWNKRKDGGRHFSTDNSSQIELFVCKGKIRISHRMRFNPTCLDEVEAYIFKLYAAGTEITGINDYDPDEHEYPIRGNDEY